MSFLISGKAAYLLFESVCLHKAPLVLTSLANYRVLFPPLNSGQAVKLLFWSHILHVLMLGMKGFSNPFLTLLIPFPCGNEGKGQEEALSNPLS